MGIRNKTNLNVIDALARSARNRAKELRKVVLASPEGTEVDQQPIYDAYHDLVEAMNDLEHYLYPGGRND